MWMAVVAESKLVPQAVPKFSVNALYIKVSWASFSLYCFQWLSTNHRISGRGDSNLVEDPLGKITIVFCGSVVVFNDCNLDDLVFRHPKPWALQHVAPRRRWGGNCQLEDVSLVFFLKVLGKWIHFWMFKCWGRNQRPYCLKGPDEVGLCQTLSVGSNQQKSIWVQRWTVHFD